MNTDRDVMLEQAALAVARAWADEWRVTMAREGRAVEGGWPGTFPEARMRAATHLGRLLVGRSMSALTYDELGRVARITYDEARRSWLGARNGPPPTTPPRAPLRRRSDA